MPRTRAHDLPEERAPRTTARELATLLSITVCGLALVNAVLIGLLRAHPLNLGHELAREKWELLAGLEAPVDTLIVGDSSGNQGLIPEQLAGLLEGTAVNLCTTANMGIANDAWMVGAYLARFGPPRRIVAVHVYDIWSRDESALRAMAWTIAEHRALWQRQEPRLSWSARERFLLTTGAYLPFYTSESTLRALVANPRRVLAREGHPIGPLGFMSVERADPENLRRDAAAHLRQAAGGRARRLSPASRAGLRALTGLSARHDVPLYVVFAPLYEGLWEDASFRRQWQSVADAIEAELAAAPRAHLLLRTPARFGAEEMENVDHVVADAARLYTERVAEAIARVERRGEPREGAPETIARRDGR